MANGPQHYRAAERILDKVNAGLADDKEIDWALAEAQVHAMLAVAAATALTGGPEATDTDRAAWYGTVGEEAQLKPIEPANSAVAA